VSVIAAEIEIKKPTMHVEADTVDFLGLGFNSPRLHFFTRCIFSHRVATPGKPGRFFCADRFEHFIVAVFRVVMPETKQPILDYRSPPRRPPRRPLRDFFIIVIFAVVLAALLAVIVSLILWMLLSR